MSLATTVTKPVSKPASQRVTSVTSVAGGGGLPANAVVADGDPVQADGQQVTATV